jgi:hypothetical protein
MGLGLGSIGIGGTPFGPIGGSLFGGGGGGNAGALKRLFDQMQRGNALRFTQAEGRQLQGLDQLRSGFDEAIQNVGRQGLASKMSIEGAGKQARASTQQRLASSGIQGTTLGAQLPGAFQGQTAQALAGVDQAVAAAKGNLLTTRGSALNAAYGNLSQLAQNQANSEMQLGSMAFGQMASQPPPEDPMMQLLGLAGMFLPMAFGAPPMPGMGGGMGSWNRPPGGYGGGGGGMSWG